MMCPFEQTCREQKKANKAKGGNALGFFEAEEDPFAEDDDLEDDDLLDDE